MHQRPRPRYDPRESLVPFQANAARRHRIPKQRHRVTNRAAHDAALRQRGSLTVWFTDWFLNKTTLGFELRTVGANPNAARYAGMSVKWNMIFAMALSGALAGLAGTIEITGVQFNMQPAFFSGLGFDAIAVALLARTNPRNMIAAGLLWGSLLAGAGLMQVRADISIDLVKIIQALIIMFIAADAIIRYLWRVPQPSEKTAVSTFSKGWGS